MKFHFLILTLFINQLLFAQSAEINYAQQIAPIINEHCVVCHQPNHIGPMPLTNHKEVSAYGQMIQYVTEQNLMPPWRASANKHGWQFENQLTESEIELIKTWVAQGLKEGPAITPFVAKPTTEMPYDTAISMAESFEQYGVYYDQYRVFVLPTNFKKDKYISGIQFIPGNSRIVRSCTISLVKDGRANSLDGWDPQYGYFAFGSVGFSAEHPHWYSWQFGDSTEILTDEFIKVIPKSANLLLHIHYGPSNQPALDSSRLLLNFTEKKETQTTIQSLPLFSINEITNPPFIIPPDSIRRFHAKVILPTDIQLHSLFPKSHFLGRSWEVFAKTPNNETISLLKIEDWDFKWKRNYKYNSPVHLPKGTTIHCLASYDNTLDNLLNPNEPTRLMQTGRRMFEENFWVFMEYSLADKKSQSNYDDLFISDCYPTTNDLLKEIQLLKTAATINLTAFNNGETLTITAATKLEKANKLKLKTGNYMMEIVDSLGNTVFRKIMGIWPDDLFE